MNDQRSLLDQLKSLHGIATKNGLYDAADWLKLHLDQKRKPVLNLTEPQRRLLKSLREEKAEPGSWTEVLVHEEQSARALQRKGLLRVRGARRGLHALEAQLIEGESSGSEESHQD